ncbi:MAG: transaldolase / glucose-6-phosphate isomerase [Actinomycetota bacterium]|jgi:glucose-6-phosphate isomerase|nr:transaldolase / glucose-6-phosphate isomerase [Actinomycetota bacterium]
MTRTSGAADWAKALAATEADLRERKAVARLYSHDHTLWGEDPTEISNRLGWLDEPQRMQHETDTLRAFARDLEADGLEHVVWCGMGGSSLFPELLAATAGAGKVQTRPGPTFTVLDSSHPAAVARIAERVPLDRTLFCFASKSGGTLETQSHLDYFSARVAKPSQLVAVTDAGSALDSRARDHGFRAVFNANPDIGGRYSALSHFGMLPAALLGLDLAAILRGAVQTVDECRDGGGGPAFALATALGAGVATGRDKLTITAWGPFGDWVEQLVAESTGKHGTGILPVVREPIAAPDHYGTDRLFTAYGVDGALAALHASGRPVLDLGRDAVDGGGKGLGREVVRWEIAIALAGALLGINPFDQPDVEAAKHAAGTVLDHGLPDLPVTAVADALATVAPGDYVAIQAFVDPASSNLERFQQARIAVRDHHRVATTLAVGPRYLHSTGQLHKGGPPSGVFLQVLDVDGGGGRDIAIPGRSFTFGDLVSAQAAGDYLALQERGRRVFRVRSDDLAAYGARGD